MTTLGPLASILWANEPARPHCPECQMRMITVRDPKSQHECLRCGHVEPVTLLAN